MIFPTSLRGECTCSLEPSGAGKTTLLRILCGLEVADSGTVLKSPDAKTVMMFQEDRLLET